MTIEEIRKSKWELEESISDLIKDFMRETDTDITELVVGYDSKEDALKDHVSSLKIWVVAEV